METLLEIFLLVERREQMNYADIIAVLEWEDKCDEELSELKGE